MTPVLWRKRQKRSSERNLSAQKKKPQRDSLGDGNAGASASWGGRLLRGRANRIVLVQCRHANGRNPNTHNFPPEAIRDPHNEHDFGCFEADGHTIFFKITMMPAEEY